jgi:Acetyltransferase (GNAT) domain
VAARAKAASSSLIPLVRFFEPADESGVLEVLQGAFGKWPRGIDSMDPGEFFRWKMTECPFGPSVSLVALDQGRVVGFVGQLRWLFRLRGQTVTSTRGVDLGVAAAYRRRGIAAAMTRWAMENHPTDVALAWNNPNDQSRPGLMKAGRRRLVILPRYVRPRAAFGRTLVRALAKGTRTPEELPVEADTAATVLGDAEYVSHVLAETVEPSERLVTARSLDYLRWRYGRFGDYRAFRADTATGAPGIVIFRLRRSGSLWVSEVCELLVAGADGATTGRMLAMVARSAAADLLSASFGSRVEAIRSGFLPVGGGTLVTARKIGSALCVEPSERAAWALSQGDVDLL